MLRCMGALAVFCVITGGNPTHGEIRYQDISNVVVKGSWFEQPEGTLEINDSTVSFDLNGDSVPDIQLSHGFVLELLLITPQAVPYINSARDGLLEIRGILQESHVIAVDSSRSGVNDWKALMANQAAIDTHLDAVNRIASTTHHNGRHLLDGSSGVSGYADDPDVRVLRVPSDTTPGTYELVVNASGQRATVLAATAQRWPLAQDERLTLNGVTISASAGLGQYEVIDRINEFTSRTEVIADANGTSGATRLYTKDAGTVGEISVVSNIEAAWDSSGFGSTQRTGAGSDVVATLGGVAFTGNGAAVVASSGQVKGLALSLAFGSGEAVTHTATGERGTVTVVDDSLEFVNRAGERTTLTLPNVRPSALGFGIVGNQFLNLDTISVLSAAKAQDSLAILDASLSEAETELAGLDTLIDVVGPRRFNSAVGLAGTQLHVLDDEIEMLPADTVVGPGDAFRTGNADVDRPGFGYLGVELRVDDETHYGWVGIATDHDGAFIVRDFAYESEPNVAIVTGVVPEVTGWHLAVVAMLGTALVGRRKVLQRTLFCQLDPTGVA